MMETIRNRFVELLPNFAAALVIIIIGLVVARILSYLLNRFLRRADRLIPHAGTRSRLDPVRMERFADVVSMVFSWVVLLLFIIAATETLGLPVLTTWLSGIALYLPRILLAALIVLAGFVGGAVLRELVAAGAASAHIAQSSFLGTLTQITVIVISLLIAINEVGIDITLLTNIITLIIAALLLSAAVGFALGAQATIGNIIASYYVQKQYRAGQTVAIDETEGKIIEITPTAVVIEARQGTVSVPAKQFIEKSSRKIADGKE